MEQIDACIYGRKIKRIFDNCLKSIREQYDIRMIDVEILLYFYENKDKTASDLYRELGLNKGQVSTGIDRLCKKKMLLEYENSKDRRYLQYEIQPLGLQVVLQIIEETKKIYTIITDSISEEKLQTCYETSMMICDNIDKFYKE